MLVTWQKVVFVPTILVIREKPMKKKCVHVFVTDYHNGFERFGCSKAVDYLDLVFVVSYSVFFFYILLQFCSTGWNPLLWNA